MLNKPSESSYLAATLLAPKPGDFPIGSAQSRAAARFLAGRRKGALIPVLCIQITNTVDIAIDDDGAEQGTTNAGGASNPLSLYLDLDPMSVGNTPVNWMTRRELETRQRKYDEYGKRCAIERDASRPSEKEVHKPGVFDEKKPERGSQPITAAPPETELESSEERSAERCAQFIEARRRPLVRPRPRRFRWPPSAYGL